MSTTYLYAITSVVIISAISLIGVFALSLKERVLRKYLFVLVGLAAGALFGDAFIHLIPESLETLGNGSMVGILIIIGILLFFILEKFLHWHHHEHSHDTEAGIHHSGKMILASDGLHNFIDGIIIAASYLAGIEVGIATTIAVMLHEIPQEIGDFGVLLNAGFSSARALFVNFLSALLAVAGAVVAFALHGSSETLIAWLIPIAAGGFIYIAASDLIPELHKTKKVGESAGQFIAIVAGVAAMVMLLFLE